MFPPMNIDNLRNKGISLTLLAFVLLMLAQPWLPESLVRPAPVLLLPFADWLNALSDFLQNDLQLTLLTRAIADVVQYIIDVTNNILLGGRKGFGLPALPWLTVACLAFMLGLFLGGIRLALLSGGTFAYLALFGQWKLAMQTLSLVFVSAPAAILIGLLLGIACQRKRWLEIAVAPLLNIAQSLPHFSYLLPVVIFFGVGHHAGAIATIVFATPPMIRMTLLGMKRISPEVIEAGQTSGCSKTQRLWRVEVPSARQEIMVGINQVIMQCLAMVVIASFIGAPGLGYKLLLLLQSLRIGDAIEIGVSIVLIAVMLDRLTLAWAYRVPAYHGDKPFWLRHRYLLAAAALAMASILIALLEPYFYFIPRREGLSAAFLWDPIVDWITLHLFDPLQAFRRFAALYILIPVRDLYQWAPFSAVMLLYVGLGYCIGGRFSAFLIFCFLGFIALSGWWDRAMITAYMVSVAVMICVVFGLSLGIWASRKQARAKTALLLCDTFQTFPSFIYLIPVIMLFQVNDLSAIAAVTIYAMIPSVRYTIEGLRNIPVELEEATVSSGANRWQRLLQLELPLALPHIMVGINQTVMFSLFMVVIAAFIGTQDLGQEMMRALSFNDLGKGLVLGFCVAFLGLTVDQLVSHWSRRRKRELGLPE